MNDASGIPESHVTISLKGDASCIHIFISEKGTRVKSKKEECDFKTCHDRKAYRTVKKGFEIPNPKTYGDPRLWRELVKAHTISGKARSRGANGKNSPLRWMSVGLSVEREDTLGKRVARKAPLEKQRHLTETSSRKHLNQFVKRKKKQMSPVPCWTTCSKMWTKPTQKSLEPNIVLIVKSTSTCTRGSKNLDDHTKS